MLLILLPIAFIPMIILFLWIRQTERFNRESIKYLAVIFLWGAAIAAGMSLLIERFLSQYIMDILILSILLAPLVEEIAKAIGLRLVKREINEIEDGIIFGITAGLGFAATENLLYGMQAWDQGILVIIALFYIRTVASGVLHASTTGVIGYGYSSMLCKKQKLLKMIPYILLAFFIHGIFNGFAYAAQTGYQIIAASVAAVFALLVMIWLRKRIIYLDKRTPSPQSESP